MKITREAFFKALASIFQKNGVPPTEALEHILSFSLVLMMNFEISPSDASKLFEASLRDYEKAYEILFIEKDKNETS